LNLEIFSVKNIKNLLILIKKNKKKEQVEVEERERDFTLDDIIYFFLRPHEDTEIASINSINEFENYCLPKSNNNDNIDMCEDCLRITFCLIDFVVDKQNNYDQWTENENYRMRVAAKTRKLFVNSELVSVLEKIIAFKFLKKILVKLNQVRFLAMVTNRMM
jgi:hypothetical protein